MSAPTSSFEMDALDEKSTSLKTTDSVIVKDTDDSNLLKETSIANLPILTYAASDEDSSLTTGILYTTEAAILQRTIKNISATLKNTPTGSSITIDIQKETGPDTNVFTTILSTLLTIDVSKFNSKTSTTQPVISDGIWENNRRIQIILTINDTNFAATGLKVTFAS